MGFIWAKINGAWDFRAPGWSGMLIHLRWIQQREGEQLVLFRIQPYLDGEHTLTKPYPARLGGNLATVQLDMGSMAR